MPFLIMRTYTLVEPTCAICYYFNCRFQVFLKMAEFHYGRHTGTRGNGKNAVFCAAYIRAEKQTCDRTGETIDFTQKHNVLYKKTYLPENAPKWVSSLDQSELSPKLWNIVEFAEKRKDSQVYIHDDIAIPIELKFAQAKQLVDSFVKERLAINGVFADVAIHWEKGNPHFHVAMPAYRTLTNLGLSKKERIPPSELSERVTQIRAEFASYANKTLEQYHHDAKIDHRSYKDRGIDLVPMQKIGKAKYMNGSLLQKDKIAKNEAIKATNLQRIQTQPEILIRRIEASKEVFSDIDIQQQALRYNVPEDLEKHHLDQLDKSRSQVVSEALNVLEKDLGIFTEKDVNRALFTLSEDTQDHQNLVTRLTQSNAVIPLGLGVDGRQTYTTKRVFQREKDLRVNISAMKQRLRFGVNESLVNDAIVQYGLNPSQALALKHITQANSAAIITGFAGTGKSYMLKPAQQIWKQSGYQPMGIALSGVVAAALEKESCIPSYTVASIVKRINEGEQVFTDKSVIVMDEMGMTNLESMQLIIAHAKTAGAKFVGIGDVEQTQSIGSGAPTRSMIEEIGTATMTEVMRQKIAWQRDATVLMETQQTAEAFDLYHQHGHIHYVDEQYSAADKLVEDWIERSRTVRQSADLLVVTYTNESADKLNEKVRQHLVDTHQLANGQSYQLADRKAQLSVGDRITFTKRDKKLGIENGYFAEIKSIDDKQLSVKIDGGETISFSLNEYNHIKHGYAATIHKIQGASVEHCFALLDSQGWDRHLMLVAGSRHKASFNLYVDGQQFKSLEDAKELVSRQGLKDHLTDYPVMFSRLRGHDVSSVSEFAARKLSGLKDKLHDSWLYLSNYSAYVEKQKQRHADALDEHHDPIREQSKVVAAYADQRLEIAQSYQEIHALKEQEKEVSLALWDAVYQQELEAGKLVHQIQHGEVDLQAAIEGNRLSRSRLEASVQFKSRHDHIHSLFSQYQQSSLWDVKSAYEVIENLAEYQKHISHHSGSSYFDLMAQLRNQAAIKQYETGLAKFGVAHRASLIQCRDYVQYEATINELRQQCKASDYKDEALQKTLNATLVKRNAFATDIVNHPELIAYFKINEKQIQRHIEQHQKALSAIKKFERFDDSTLAKPIYAKQVLAKNIKAELVTYAPYFEHLVKAGLKQVNIENWHYEKQQALREMKYPASCGVSVATADFKSPPGASNLIPEGLKASASIQLVGEYFEYAQAVRENFGKHQHLKEKDSPRQQTTLAMAQSYAIKRNQLAHQIMQDAHVHMGVLTILNMDTKKLSEQYRAHETMNRYLNVGNMHQRQLADTILNDYGQYGHYISHYGLANQLKSQCQVQSVSQLAKAHQAPHMISAQRMLTRYLDNHHVSQKAWHQAQKPWDNKAEFIRLANAYHKKADAYAHQIMQNKADYEEVISLRYPDEAKREKLMNKIASRAETNQKRLTIRAYIDPAYSKLQREQAAYALNQDFKGHVALGYDEGLYWGNVSKIAYPEKVRQARAKLDVHYHEVFDSLQAYNKVCRQAGEAFGQVKALEKMLKSQLKLADTAEIPQEKVTVELKQTRESMFKLMAHRHEVAYEIREDFPELETLTNTHKENIKDVVPGYKPQKFATHVKYHEAYLEAKERVAKFAALSVEQRLQSGMALAHEMTQHIGKHRFHLQHHDIKEADIWQLAQRHQYQLESAKLPGAEKQLHQTLVDYVVARDDAKAAWQGVRNATKQGQDNVGQKQKAIAQNGLRDEKAYRASQLLGQHLDSPVFERFVTHQQAWRNIEVTRLVQSAQDHQLVMDLQRYQQHQHSDQAREIAYELSGRYLGKALHRQLLNQQMNATIFWQDARVGQQSVYRQGLPALEQEHYDRVLAYRAKSIEVAAAYSQGDKKLGGQLAQARNALAVNIRQDIAPYETHLVKEKINLERLEEHANQLARPKQKLSAVKAKVAQPEVKVQRQWDVNRITEALMRDPVSTYTQIFGQPKKVSTFEARWSNGTVVSLKGNQSGRWYSFVQEKGGSPVQALMETYGLRFVDALKKGAEIANLTESQAQTERYVVQAPAVNRHQDKIDRERLHKIEAAQSIWMGTQPLAGTLSERYLQEHRNIQATNKLEIRHWPKGAKWVDYNDQGQRIERINKIPALVIKAEDLRGDISAVQRVYLDEQTTGKNTFMGNAKLSKGAIQGAAGIIQKDSDRKVIIAEGPETAASLAIAYPQSTVLTSFSISNLAALKPVINELKPKQVIIAADNDGENAETRYQIEDSARKLGDNIEVRYPGQLADQKKTDWNDVLKTQGLEGVRMQFELQSLRATAAEKYLTKHEVLQDTDFSSYRYDVQADQIVLDQSGTVRYDYHKERMVADKPYLLKEAEYTSRGTYVCQNLQDAHAIQKMKPDAGIIMANTDQLSQVKSLTSSYTTLVMDNVQPETHQLINEQARALFPKGGEFKAILADIKEPHTHTSIAEVLAANPEYRMKRYNFPVKPASLTEKLFSKRKAKITAPENLTTVARPKTEDASQRYYLNRNDANYLVLKKYMDRLDQLKKQDTLQSAIALSQASLDVKQTFKHKRFEKDIPEKVSLIAVAMKHLKQEKPLNIKEQQALVTHSRQVRVDNDTRLQMQSVVKEMVDNKDYKQVQAKLLEIADQKKDLIAALNEREKSYQSMTLDYAMRVEKAFDKKAFNLEHTSALIKSVENETRKRKESLSQNQSMKKSKNRGFRR